MKSMNWWLNLEKLNFVPHKKTKVHLKINGLEVLDNSVYNVELSDADLDSYRSVADAHLIRNRIRKDIYKIYKRPGPICRNPASQNRADNWCNYNNKPE